MSRGIGSAAQFEAAKDPMVAAAANWSMRRVLERERATVGLHLVPAPSTEEVLPHAASA